jgi:hypothetical protein
LEFYAFESGEKQEVPAFKTPSDINLMFKLNLPSSRENFESGNGEGVWACTDNPTLERLNKDGTGGIYFARVLNDSVYYPTLKCDTIVAMEMRGDKRPVALYDELIEKFGKSKRDEVIRFMK